MANKPIINIDVNAEQFKAFYELYEQFEAKVGSMPKEWQQIDTSMRRNAATAKTLASGIQSSTEAQRQFNIMAREGLHTMSKMAKEAGNVGKAVFDIGKWLLKFGAISGGIAGLGGILGSISLRDLAHSAVMDQRGARGVGLTPGQFKAFGMDFGRFLDPSILSKVADQQADFTGRMWLSQASGMPMDRVANAGPDQLAMQLATRAHDWWNKTPASMRTAQVLQATGFQSVFSLEDMRRLGNTPISELQSARSQYSRDQRSLNVSNGTTQAWYEFDRQLSLAGRTIETALTNRLVELAPSLRSFVTTLTKDADQLINDIFTPKNLKSIEDGITTMTTYLGSSTFRQDMKDFVGLIGAAVNAMRAVAKLLGVEPGSSLTDPVSKSQDGKYPNSIKGGLAKFGYAIRDAFPLFTGDMASGPNGLDLLAESVQNKVGAPAYFGDLEKKYGLPMGLLARQEWVESRGKVGAISPRGAMGPFQFMPDTAKQYGLQDPFNLHDSAVSAAQMMSDLKKHYGGDIRKALAAYNWGQGNLDKNIAKNGSQWESGLPAETRAYINNIAVEVAKRSAVKVQVQVSNNTSARVAVQANAAAPGN